MNDNKNNRKSHFPFISSKPVNNQFCSPVYPLGFPFPYGDGYTAIIPQAPTQSYPSDEETSLYELDDIIVNNSFYNSCDSLVFSKFINSIIDDAEQVQDPSNFGKTINLMKQYADAHMKISVKTIDFIEALADYFGGDPDIGTTENEDPVINIETLMNTLMNPDKVKSILCLSTMVVCLGPMKLRTFANILRSDSPVYDSQFAKPTSLSLKTFLEELRNSYEEVDFNGNPIDGFLRNQYRLILGETLLKYASRHRMRISEVFINVWYDTYFPVLGYKDENSERDLFIDRFLNTNRFAEGL